MTLIDFTQLDPEPLRLTLHRSEGGYYSVTDQNGRLFTPPSTNVAFHVRFMTAMAAKRDAVIDAASVEAFSVRVPSALSESGGRKSGRQTTSPRADSGTDPQLLWPKPDSESVPTSGEAELARTDGNQPLASPDSTRRLRLVV